MIHTIYDKPIIDKRSDTWQQYTCKCSNNAENDFIQERKRLDTCKRSFVMHPCTNSTTHLASSAMRVKWIADWAAIKGSVENAARRSPSANLTARQGSCVFHVCRVVPVCTSHRRTLESPEPVSSRVLSPVCGVKHLNDGYPRTVYVAGPYCAVVPVKGAKPCAVV